jgi:hypothetical protein
MNPARIESGRERAMISVERTLPKKMRIMSAASPAPRRPSRSRLTIASRT